MSHFKVPIFYGTPKGREHFQSVGTAAIPHPINQAVPVTFATAMRWAWQTNQWHITLNFSLSADWSYTDSDQAPTMPPSPPPPPVLHFPTGSITITGNVSWFIDPQVFVPALGTHVDTPDERWMIRGPTPSDSFNYNPSIPIATPHFMDSFDLGDISNGTGVLNMDMNVTSNDSNYWAYVTSAQFLLNGFFLASVAWTPSPEGWAYFYGMDSGLSFGMISAFHDADPDPSMNQFIAEFSGSVDGSPTFIGTPNDQQRSDFNIDVVTAENTMFENDSASDCSDGLSPYTDGSMHVHTSSAAMITVNTFNIDSIHIAPSTFWEYRNSEGSAIYDGAGNQIQDPFS
jgi:hypothetical protein